MKIFRFIRQEFWFLVAILGMIVLFFPEMFALKMSFLSGDHRAQHYPWAYFYAEGIKQLQLPWWTNYFHCGFPLLAEGQVGAFYPLNLFFYFFFPFKFAYTYNILTHYVLAGFFFYGYLRHRAVSNWASLFGTAVYLFGTAQGGYYYNLISIKTLIWLPLTFYLIDQILLKKNKIFIWFLGIVFAFQLFAGYLQYAVYSIAFSCFYFLWFSFAAWKQDRNSKKFLGNILGLGCALVVAGVLALPQLGSTIELSLFSNRYGFSEEFAYVGSLNPLALATVFFPHWDGFLGAEIYVGGIGFFFLLVMLWLPKKKTEIFFIVMALLALSIALGKYNPLYVMFVKVTGFTSFRVPTKFIYFAATAIAVLIAFGVDKWIRGNSLKQMHKASTVFLILSFVGGLGLIFSNVIMRVFKAPIMGLGQSYLIKHFTNSDIHKAPIETYLERLYGFYDGILQSISLISPWNLFFMFMLVVGVFFVLFLRRVNFKFSKKLMIAAFIFLYVNLYFYGWTSVKGGYEAYSFVSTESRIVDYLKQDDELFRVHRIFHDIYEAERLPLMPHVNLFDKIAIVGGYSPLVMARYYELLDQLGDVNDSNQLRTFEKNSLSEQRSLMNFLNVKYIITKNKANVPFWEEVLEEDGNYLYENTYYLQRLFFVSRGVEVSPEEVTSKMQAEQFMPTRRVFIDFNQIYEKTPGGKGDERFMNANIEDYQQEEMLLKINAPSSGFLVSSDVFYPGWKALLNGEKKDILKVNSFFRAIQIPGKGQYDVKMYYDPIWKKLSFLPFLGYFVTIILLVGYLLRKKRYGITK